MEDKLQQDVADWFVTVVLDPAFDVSNFLSRKIGSSTHRNVRDCQVGCVWIRSARSCGLIGSATSEEDKQPYDYEYQQDSNRDRNDRRARLFFSARWRAKGRHVTGRAAHSVKLYRLSDLDAAKRHSFASIAPCRRRW